MNNVEVPHRRDRRKKSPGVSASIGGDQIRRDRRIKSPGVSPALARKYAAGVKRGKLCHQARENIEPVPSAGNHAIGAKTCHRYKARENIQSLLSAGKHVTVTECGKT